MIHTIFFRSHRSICPKCGGQTRQLNSDELILYCIDCKTCYRAIGCGQAEAELDFEEVQIGE